MTLVNLEPGGRVLWATLNPGEPPALLLARTRTGAALAKRISNRGSLKARQALEHAAPIDPANQRVNEIFGMRHEAKNIEPLRVDSGDVIDRAVGIAAAIPCTPRVRIADGDAAVALDARDRFPIGDVISLAMGDRHFDDLALGILGGKRGIVALDGQMLHPADEPQIGVAHQHARQ
jgi:hypothetical protein